MILTVYHADWTKLHRDVRWALQQGDAAIARRLYMTGQYKRVAVLAAGDEEDAFRLTNHIESDWQHNKEVKWSEPRARSTSCGDIICTDSKTLLVAPIGFTDLEIDPEMDRYWQHYRETE